MGTPRRFAVLASGRGSTMEAIADAGSRGEITAELALVLCNEPEAVVLQKARDRNLVQCCVPHRDYPDRDSFEGALIGALREQRIDFVVLAGFMRILTERFVREYYGSLLNIHPSLLPKYPGLHTHQRAIDAGDSHAGTSVHYVTPELDGGPVIAQARVPIEPGDDATRLAARVQREERWLYPQVIEQCVSGQVELRDGKVWRDESVSSNN